MTRSRCRGLIATLLACGLFAPSSNALVREEKPPLAEKILRHPNLHIPTRLQPAIDLQDDLGARIQRDLAALAINGDSAFYDARAGRLTSLILSEPLIPGTGVGNKLQWVGGLDQALNEEKVREIVWTAVRGFVQERQAQLRVDVAELGTPHIAIFDQAALVQVVAQRVINGIPVRDSNMTAVLNHGNLILLGFDHWGDAPNLQTLAAVGDTQAALRVAQHASPNEIESFDKVRLEYIPMVSGDEYEYRLAWVVPAAIVGDHGSWEGLVDAATGELFAFEDRNQYARRVVGGVYPISNDQRPPDGIEQPGWPMPFASVTAASGPATTSASGTLACSVTGAVTTALAGPFIRMADICGAINESAPGDLDLGVSAGTDCVVPAGHSVGDTHSSRSGFYELNRIKEQARGYLPANAWLSAQLTSNMNINNQCNAFWSTAAGTVNFYRDNGSQCRNTGEIAAIFDHEWGHGMDANGVQAGVSPRRGHRGHPRLPAPRQLLRRAAASSRTRSAAVTAIPATERSPRAAPASATSTSWPTPATGPTLSPGSSRDSPPPSATEWPGPPARRRRHPCSRATHCEGKIVGESAYDLARRDFPAAPFLFDTNTAHELTTRLFTIGAGPVTSWYTCAVGGGCGATGGYMQVLAVDDDNGNLNDGTPHMTAIRAAFERHEIHCATPAPVNSGCVGGPALAPALTATAGTESVSLSWTPVPGAARYYVYRTEGVAACAVNGKIKIADVTGTTFTDNNLLGGRQFSYMVLPVGANTSCFGRASACANATPTAAVCAAVSVAPVGLAVDAAGNGVFQPGETAVMTPTWRNTGTAPIALTGATSGFTGPPVATYNNPDSSASYGTIGVASQAPCTDCYTVNVVTANRPLTHWDSTILETVNPSATTKTWTLHIGDSFTDVPASNPFFRFVETILHKNVTGGCTHEHVLPGQLHDP